MAATTYLASRTPEIRESRRRIGGLLLLMSITISFLAGSVAPTPLYQRYSLEWHGTALTTTEAFGVYALAVLGGLLVLGELSNHLGRRPILLGALALQGIALVLFATAGSYEPLFLGRILQGIAAGAALGTIGAAMIELHREHGTTASSAAPGLGTGIGALVSGLAAAYLPWPTHLIYLALIGVFILQAVGVMRLIEANPTRPGAVTSLRPTIAVPGSARRAFAAAAPALLAFWALAGFYGSLGPALVRSLAPGSSVALGSITLFVMAVTASVAAYLQRRREARLQLLIGVAGLVVGSVGAIAAIEGGSIWGLLAATLFSGYGFGLGLQGSIQSVVPLSHAQERAGLLSAVYLVSYAGFGAPAVIAGWLVSRGDTLTHVAIGYAAVLIALALLAGTQLVRRVRVTAPRAER